MLTKNNEPMLDADFEEVLEDLYSSPVIDAFPWLVDKVTNASVTNGWAVYVQDILKDSYLSLDPKRYCRKFRELQQNIQNSDHISLLDLCDVIPQSWSGKKNDQVYRYVEIGNVFDNGYEYVELRGWQLPDRAKHKANFGDIFIGSVWGSVKKWFIAGKASETGNLIVTNGFHKLRIKENLKHLLPDLVFALSSEYYQVQMRALATGSDGLSEVSEEDLRQILIPLLDTEEIRTEIEQYIMQSMKSEGSITHYVENTITKNYPHLKMSLRKTNFSQV